MNLEDHLGDIIRKARGMSNVSAAAAAAAAGLTEAQLAALEDSGNPIGPVNLAALAALTGLHAGKLQKIAGGWLPSPKDISRWRQLRAFTSAGAGLTVNCFLLWDESTRDAALFDTGFEAKPIQDTLATEQLQLRHIFITHSHHDHVHALGTLREAHPKAQVHSSSPNAPVDQRNTAGAVVQVGGLRITHRETPGHAADGVTYTIGGWRDAAPAVAVVGDAIFAGSMGRGNQSWELACQKVREHILSMPLDTLLCPGHGPLTTVAEELAHNPFF